MRAQDLRTAEEQFDDLLADDYSLPDIAYRLGWSYWRTRAHYRFVCASVGELPNVSE